MRVRVDWGEIEIYGEWDGESFMPDDYAVLNEAAKESVLDILQQHIDNIDPGYFERKAAAHVKEEQEWKREEQREAERILARSRALEISRIRRYGT